MAPPPKFQRPGTTALVVAWMFALVLMGLGALAIWDAQFSGTTKQSQSIDVEGVSAQWMGSLQISLGLMMLGLTMPSQRAALRWMLGCVALVGLCLVMALCTR